MIRFAYESEIPELKKIWHACFDDSKEFVDSHYANRKDTTRTIVFCEDDKIVSMFDMVNIQVKSENNIYKAFYIYAAATLPEYQGKGYMHKLIEQACSICKDEGMLAAVLIPQTKSLIEFYQKQGFQQPITNDVIEFSKSGSAATITDLSENEFIAMKTEYENSFQDGIIHGDDLCSLIYKQTETLEGHTVKIKTERNESYAICFKEKRQFIIQEISSSDEYLERDISALCDLYGVKKARVVRPGNRLLYGLARPLADNNINWDNLYMNTMLD